MVGRAERAAVVLAPDDDRGRSLSSSVSDDGPSRVLHQGHSASGNGDAPEPLRNSPTPSSPPPSCSRSRCDRPTARSKARRRAGQGARGAAARARRSGSPRARADRGSTAAACSEAAPRRRDPRGAGCPRNRRSASVNAITPRYASVLPPPVGKKISSTGSRSGAGRRARRSRLSRTNASWNRCHCGSSSLSRCRACLAIASFARPNARRASALFSTSSMPPAIRCFASVARASSTSTVSRSAAVIFTARCRCIHLPYASGSAPRPAPRPA